MRADHRGEVIATECAEWAGSVAVSPLSRSLPLTGRSCYTLPVGSPVFSPLLDDALRALRASGFPLVGTAPVVHDASDIEAYEHFLAAGHHGPLDYLSRSAKRRTDLRHLYPWAKGALCAAMPYRTQREDIPASAKVSCYAWGRDYHKTLRKRLKGAEEVLQRAGHRARVCVDSVPILERALCRRAGLGFIGKNGMLLHPEYGSYLFLGVVITDLEVPAGTEIPEGCGTCTRCLAACPTEALVAPRILDARRCISTWTVEHQGDFPEETPPLHGHLFGCDLCQEACPYNPRAPLSEEVDFCCRFEWKAATPEEVLGWDEERMELALSGSPLRRAGAEGLRRNAERLIQERGA